jgi:dTDP-4-dehydrorhamnose reductase
MRVVVVGAAGQLGRELLRVLPGETVGLARTDLDLREADAIAPTLAALAPTVVVNATAENRVDAAEDDPTDAVLVNALAVGAMARACRALDAVLVHVSTDYVFDGRAARPYTEDDPPNPESVYARTKLAGELLVRSLAPRHAVVRVAGLYAHGGSRGKGGSFIDRVLAQARAGQPLRIVDDQVTAPTWARDVAEAIVRLVPRLRDGGAPSGVYHVTNGGSCSWYEFARAALELAGVRAELSAVSSAAFAAKAPRPAYSVLANARLAAVGEPLLRPWRAALEAYLDTGGERMRPTGSTSIA